MAQTSAIEATLAAWRDAERRLARAVDGEAETLRLEIGTHRDNYQRLSAAGMAGWMAKLKEAEKRRSHARPSTPPFHQAARDTQEIAAAIWEAARSGDEDTPQTEQNQRATPRRTESGVSDQVKRGSGRLEAVAVGTPPATLPTQPGDSLAPIVIR